MLTMTEFKREERYIVLKIKDLEALPQQAFPVVQEVITSIEPFLPKRRYVVVEDDWPEYELVWGMIERRVGKEGGANADSV